MRRDILLLLSLVIPAAWAAQESPKGVVEGTVLDDVAGAPVGLAAVRLMWQCAAKPPESLLVNTQADGRFRFEGLEPNCYSVMAQKSGYLDPVRNGEVTSIQLASGQQKTGLTLKLTPQSILSGRVFSDDGELLQGVEVQALQRKKAAGKQQWERNMSAVSDNRGEYRIAELTAGEYAVSATYRGGQTRLDTGDQTLQVYATTYYPKGIELNAAKIIAVRKGGETAGIDVRLRKVPAFRVRLRIDGVTAGEWLGTTISVESRDSRELGELQGIVYRRVEPGVIEVLGVPAGSWFVQAHAAPTNDVHLTGTAAIEVTTADLTDVVVLMSAPHQLTGQFVFEGTPPGKLNWKDQHVWLERMEGPHAGYVPGLGAVTADGEFSVPYKFPGKHTLGVQGLPFAMTYLASIQVGGEEYYGKEIDLTAAPPGPVKIIFRDDAAKISGKLEGAVGGEPGQLGLAVLVPVEVHLRRYPFMPMSQVRTDGKFAFGPVRPGEYLLCHMLGNSQTLYENGVPPKESMDAAIRVKVEPGGTHILQLKAIKPR